MNRMTDLIFETSDGAGRTIRTTDGETLLYFGGTGYLGLSQHIDFQKLVYEGIQKYGLNYGSSRISNLRLKIYEEAENFLAQKIGTAKTLTFSSGYMAGQAVMQWLKKTFPNIPISYAPETHPAVQCFDNQPKTMFENFENWLKNEVQKINQSSESEFILVMDSVDSLRGKTRDFSILKKITPSKRVILVVDDSHGIGVLGRVGAGITDSLPNLPQFVKITVGSLGKACGVPAGFVASASKIIDELAELSIFRGASPAMPCFLWAFIKAEKLRIRQLEILRERISFFSHQIDAAAFSFSADYPVFFAYDAALASQLTSEKIALWHFTYSTVFSEKYTRIVLNSAHTKEDLEKLIQILNTLKS